MQSYITINQNGGHLNETIDKALAQNANPYDCGYPRDFVSAYITAREYNLDRIDIGDAVFSHTLEDIVSGCLKAGISEFTVSVHQTDMQDIFAELFSRGGTFSGIVQIPDHWCPQKNNNAFLFRL